MAKKSKKNKKVKSGALDKHNSYGYLKDLNRICKLGYISDSTRDWIETNMLRLRDCANVYEHKFGEYLIKKNVEFIHQAPFILSGKIYFADFYLPKYNLIVEIDGLYHSGMAQHEYDRFRDACFCGHKIKVLRLPNNAVMNDNDLNILTSKHII